LKRLGILKVQRPGGMRENNRAGNSHLPIRKRERKQQQFKSQGSAQRFLSAHGPIYNLFNTQQHLVSRPTLRTFRGRAFEEWNVVTKAA
jgi:putative transposase